MGPEVSAKGEGGFISGASGANAGTIGWEAGDKG